MASSIYIIRNIGAVNNLISGHPDATFYHTPLWSKILEETGLGKVYYIVIDDIGIVPMYVKSRKAYIWGDFGHPLFLRRFVTVSYTHLTLPTTERV